MPSADMGAAQWRPRGAPKRLSAPLLPALVAAIAAVSLIQGLWIAFGASASFSAPRLPFLEWFEAESVSVAKAAIRAADAVCFDVDSTLVQTEGIDVLAGCFGKQEPVANITRLAMEGGVQLQDAMEQRLQIMQPTEEGFAACVDQERPRFTPGAHKVITRLQARGAEVYLVSGGFTAMIEPVAEALNVPKAHIFANTVVFDQDGKYLDFDREAPTSMSGGKRRVVERLQRERGFRTVVMVGDGVTDMEAKPPAAAFIGYGGVAVRGRVKEGADWFVTSWEPVLRALA